MGSALSFQVASYNFHQTLANGQAKARALVAVALGVVQLREFVEDARELIRRDSDSGVRNAQAHSSFLVQLRGYLHAAAIGKLDRVADQIANDATQFDPVGTKPD